MKQIIAVMVIFCLAHKSHCGMMSSLAGAVGLGPKKNNEAELKKLQEEVDKMKADDLFMRKKIGRLTLNINRNLERTLDIVNNMGVDFETKYNLMRKTVMNDVFDNLDHDDPLGLENISAVKEVLHPNNLFI